MKVKSSGFFMMKTVWELDNQETVVLVITLTCDSPDNYE